MTFQSSSATIEPTRIRFIVEDEIYFELTFDLNQSSESEATFMSDLRLDRLQRLSLRKEQQEGKSSKGLQAIDEKIPHFFVHDEHEHHHEGYAKHHCIDTQ